MVLQLGCDPGKLNGRGGSLVVWVLTAVLFVQWGGGQCHGETGGEGGKGREGRKGTRGERGRTVENLEYCTSCIGGMIWVQVRGGGTCR